MAEWKTKKIAEILYPDYYEVILVRNGAPNPFWLYRRERKDNKYGYPYLSKTLVAKYADMNSCLYRIMQNH